MIWGPPLWRQLNDFFLPAEGAGRRPASLPGFGVSPKNSLACLLAKKGIETTLWEHRPERAIEMQQQRENTLFLPGIRFPAMLYVTSQVAEAAREKDMLLLVTPSQRMRENVRLLAPYVGKG
ncbi:MAG: hypothetical protein E6J44_11225, partial [Chloroflexi bacterium]